MTQVGNNASISGANLFQTSMSDNSSSSPASGLPSRRPLQATRRTAPADPQWDRNFRNNSVPDHQLHVMNTHSLNTGFQGPPFSQSSSTAPRRASAFPVDTASRQHEQSTASRSRREPRGMLNLSMNGQTGIHNPWNTGIAESNEAIRSVPQPTGVSGDPSSTDLLPVEQTNGATQATRHGLWSSRHNPNLMRGFQSPTATRDSFGSDPVRALKESGTHGDSQHSDREVLSSRSQRSASSDNFHGFGHEIPPNPYNQGNAEMRNFANESAPVTELEKCLQMFSFHEAPQNHHFYRQSPPNLPNGKATADGLSRTGSSPGHSSYPPALGWNGAINSAWRPSSNGNGHGNSEPSSSLIPYGLDVDSNLRQNPRGDPTPISSLRRSRRGSPNGFVPGLQPSASGSEIGDTSASRFALSNRTLEDGFNCTNGRNGYRAYDMPRLQSQQVVTIANRTPFRESSPYNNIYNGISPSSDTNIPPMFGGSQHPNWQSVPLALPDPNGIPYIVEPDSGKKWSSSLIQEFRHAGRTGTRWELKDVFDHIVEFSGDQSGSRFLQDKLKTANSEEKDRVFSEIAPNAVPLMKDFYGNYVLQKLFEHGSQVHKAALVRKMEGHVYTLSTQAYACRVVQKALGFILVEQQSALMRELDGKVMDCIKCENGNHVVQVAIEQVPHSRIPFMINAIRSDMRYLSMHKYGCRVVQRLLEHSKEDILTWLIPELHRCSDLLIGDQYGNYVLAHIIEKGNVVDRDQVIDVVRHNLIRYSREKFASHVVEKCIRFGSDSHRHQFMQIFCAPNELGEDQLENLIRDSFANYVIQSMLESLHREDYIRFCRLLDPAVQRARFPWPSKQAENVVSKMNRYPYGWSGG